MARSQDLEFRVWGFMAVHVGLSGFRAVWLVGSNGATVDESLPRHNSSVSQFSGHKLLRVLGPRYVGSCKSCSTKNNRLSSTKGPAPLAMQCSRPEKNTYSCGLVPQRSSAFQGGAGRFESFIGITMHLTVNQLTGSQLSYPHSVT